MANTYMPKSKPSTMKPPAPFGTYKPTVKKGKAK